MISVPGEYGAGQVNGVEGAMLDELSEPSGRYVVVLADNLQGDEKAMSAALQSVAGVSNILSSTDLSDGTINIERTRDADATLFPALGVAVVAGDPERLASLTTAAGEDDRIEAVEPEQTLYALSQPGVLAADYLRGYRDAAAELYEHANGGGGVATGVDLTSQFVDTAQFTWGLQVTQVSTSAHSGQGVAVAILDSGLDLHHPDFVGRTITSRSFVPNQAPQDGNGHGTHLVGTSSGPAHPPGGGRRYGIAYKDDIFIGKVFNNQGSGNDGQVLAGINWAVANSCRAVLFAGGSAARQVSPVYETVGRRALNAGCLIIAAAGGNAHRTSDNFGFVGMPANCPSIMAVGAVDNQLRIANFSPRSNPAVGSEIDIVGPGVNVYSSWSTSGSTQHRYHTISGTSMAAAHVAGIAALLIQATGAHGAALWGQLVRTARRLPIPSIDVGAGLAQAPQ